jgi:hypothetical protein
MTLSPEEFMRRFLLHVLPGGFHRIRHYGLLANSSRKASLALARKLLSVPKPLPNAVEGEDANVKPPTFVCHHCGRALLIVQTFARGHAIRGPPQDCTP